MIILRHSNQTINLVLNMEIKPQIVLNRVNNFPHRVPPVGSGPVSAPLTETERGPRSGSQLFTADSESGQQVTSRTAQRLVSLNQPN